MALPLLPTTVVGSYSMPGWLERLKTEFYARRISRRDLDEIHDTAVKAAIKDQELAGVDVISDGELRRDNMIDYFAERLPGVQIDHTSKKFHYDFYDSKVLGKLPMGPLGLVDDVKFCAQTPIAKQDSASLDHILWRSASAMNTTRANRTSLWTSPA